VKKRGYRKKKDRGKETNSELGSIVGSLFEMEDTSGKKGKTLHKRETKESREVRGGR